MHHHKISEITCIFLLKYETLILLKRFPPLVSQSPVPIELLIYLFSIINSIFIDNKKSSYTNTILKVMKIKY